MAYLRVLLLFISHPQLIVHYQDQIMQKASKTCLEFLMERMVINQVIRVAPEKPREATWCLKR